MATLLRYDREKNEAMLIIDGNGYLYKSVKIIRADAENKYFSFTGIESVKNQKCDVTAYVDAYEVKRSFNKN